MPVVVLANPRAGRGRSVGVAGDLIARLGERGIDASVVTPVEHHVASAVHEALAAGADTVIACGGDGTAHQVLQPLVGSEAAFGILPTGTGNDIASVLGMKRDALTALVLAVEQQRTRHVDVGRATWGNEQSWFLGVLSTGFDSTVNERANRMSWPTGRARYLAGVAIELSRFRARQYSVRIDDESLTGPGMLVCVANAGRYGGGMQVCPDAEVDDGELDITWVDDIPIRQFLRVLPRVFNGSHVSNPAVRTYRARHVHVDAPGQTAYADGERLGELPVTIDVVPGALRVLDTTPTGRA